MNGMSKVMSWSEIESARAAREAAYTTAAILLVFTCFAISVLSGPLYALVAAGLTFGVIAFFRPSAGLWLSPCLIMLASLVAPPEGFQYGAGYSPELTYWAGALCLVFVSLLFRYIWSRGTVHIAWGSGIAVSPPRALFAFLAFCIFSAALGLMRGYSIGNVGKQLYGCLLFCMYFLFALRFAPREKDGHRVLRNLWWGGVGACFLYLVIYFWKMGSEGVRKDLTILSAYGAGLSVLSIPELLMPGRRSSKFRLWISVAILLGVPFFAGYKRGVASFAVCALVWAGLRLRSTLKRSVVVVVALAVVGVLLGTGLLDPIVESVGEVPVLSQFKLGDVQTNYSVFLRLEELRQVIDSLHGVPLLGTGLGSTLSWYDPYARTVWEQETLDIGWGYLLVKIGIVGTVIFLWLLLIIFVPALRRRLSGTEAALFLLILFGLLQMVADTFMVYFMTAGWMGTTCGFLYQSLRAQPGASWNGDGMLVAASPPPARAANALG